MPEMLFHEVEGSKLIILFIFDMLMLLFAVPSSLAVFPRLGVRFEIIVCGVSSSTTVDIAETKPHTTVFVSSSTPILTYFAPKIYIHEPNSNALVFLFSIPSNISVRFEKLPFSAMLNLYSFVPICIM